MNLMDRLSQYRSEEAKLKWEGSFADYFDLVKKNPRIARLAHARIFDMIMADGLESHGKSEPPIHAARGNWVSFTHEPAFKPG